MVERMCYPMFLYNMKVQYVELEKFSKKNSSSPYEAAAKIRETAFREPLAKIKKAICYSNFKI